MYRIDHKEYLEVRAIERQSTHLSETTPQKKVFLQFSGFSKITVNQTNLTCTHRFRYILPKGIHQGQMTLNHWGPAKPS